MLDRAEPTLPLAEIARAGRRGVWVEIDLADTDDVAAAVRRGEEAVGRPADVVVSNVGAYRWPDSRTLLSTRGER